MNSAYVVGHLTVKDADRWAEYRRQVPATLAPWGGELVFRGTQIATLAGHSPHPDIVVIRAIAARYVSMSRHSSCVKSRQSTPSKSYPASWPCPAFCQFHSR